MDKKRFLFFGILIFISITFVSSFVNAVDLSGILPADRIINWSQVGIPGGIPDRAICSVTVASGASQSTIQNALNSQLCLNKAVYLPAGNYTISGTLTIPSNVTLRGAGPGKTILKVSPGFSVTAIRFGPYNAGYSSQIADSDWPSGNARVFNIASGYTKGSTSITLSTTPTGIYPGDLITLDEKLDSALPVSLDGQYGTAQYGSRESNTRALGQTVEVKTVSGSTITFWPPMYWTYKNSLVPQALHFTLGAQYAGLEYVTVFDTSTSKTDGILIGGSLSKYVWVKGVEGDTSGGDHVNIMESYGCEIRDSYFHDGQWHGSGNTDNNVLLAYKTSGCLVENNIFFRQHVGAMIKISSGNVISYNWGGGGFHRDPGGEIVGAQIETLNGNHYAHPQFNLFEGNHVEGSLKIDRAWGSSSHGIIFRNWITADGLRYNPVADGRPSSVDYANPTRNWQYTRGIILERDQNYYSIIGNILGDQYVKSTANSIYLLTNPSSRQYQSPPYYLIELGYDDTTVNGQGSKNDATVQSTLMHGNYDYISSTFKWNSSIIQSIPSSAYLAFKPSWWNNSYSWPAFGPDISNPSSLLQGRIPAEICMKDYVMKGKKFDPITCYGATSSNPQPPYRSAGKPSGELTTGTTSVSVNLTTDIASTCKYSLTSGVTYGAMTLLMSASVDRKFHEITVSGLISDGIVKNYYVRCVNYTNSSLYNTDDYLISFYVKQDVAPTITSVSPSNGAVLSYGTTSTTLSVTTDESATCKYSTTQSVYASMENTMSGSTTTHTSSISGLTNGASRIIYIRCSDSGGLISSLTTLSFSVSSSFASNPTFIGNYSTSFGTTSTSATTQTFNVESGDVLVAYSSSENNVAGSLGISSSNGLVWKVEGSVGTSGNYAPLKVWSANVTTTGTMSVTFTKSGSYQFGGGVMIFRNSDGIGNFASTTGDAAAPLVNILTSRENSAIVVLNSDYAAISGSRTYRTNAGSFVERNYYSGSGTYSFYFGYHPNAGSVASYGVGLTSPTGQTFSIAAIEVKGKVSQSTFNYHPADNNPQNKIIEYNEVSSYVNGYIAGNYDLKNTLYVITLRQSGGSYDDTAITSGCSASPWNCWVNV